jgi:hypothetical protein
VLDRVGPEPRGDGGGGPERILLAAQLVVRETVAAPGRA